jgi:hypothetical protein
MLPDWQNPRKDVESVHAKGPQSYLQTAQFMVGLLLAISYYSIIQTG